MRSTRTSGRLYWQRQWVALGVLLSAAVALLALSPLAREVTRLARVVPQGDKWVHGATFALLMLMWGSILRSPGARGGLACGGLLLGVLIELAQWPIAPADADVFDVVADALGLALGLWLLRTPLADMLVHLESRLRG